MLTHTWRVLTFERKSIPMVAWYMLSKESYMNRVIRDVLPTAIYQRIALWIMVSTRIYMFIPLCSPKKTSLYRPWSVTFCDWRYIWFPDSNSLKFLQGIWVRPSRWRWSHLDGKFWEWFLIILKGKPWENAPCVQILVAWLFVQERGASLTALFGSLADSGILICWKFLSHQLKIIFPTQDFPLSY